MPKALKFKPLKLILFASILLLLITLYSVFKEEIYTWSCHNENVESSCAVVGIINLEKGHTDTAKEYFNKACDMKYQIACDKLKEIDSSSINSTK